MRLISAVMGGRTFKGREAESKKLLTWGFRFFETVNPLKVGKEFASEPVWFGDSDRASLGVDKDVYLTIPRGRMKDLKASYVLNSSELHAPLQRIRSSVLSTSSLMAKRSNNARWLCCKKSRKATSSAKSLITLN